jgi:DNA-binding XRE family transcriptional regulator
MTTDRYKPVRVDLDATRRRWSRDKDFREAYDALADEFEALSGLLRMRQKAGLTQAEVAERMGVAQASVARLEASAGSRKHAPSMATLRRYADAVGCQITLWFEPKAKSRRSA